MKKGFVFFLFCLMCEEVFAGVFSVIPTDKSQEYLGMVFGGSVGAISLGGDVNPTLSLMFERFNLIVVSIGAVVLSYIGIMTTINTAREGEAMGKKMSLWVPLRAFAGMLLMVPGPTSGYSVVQMTVMWIVLNGVGAANSVWDVVLGQLAKNAPVAGAMGIAIKPATLKPLAKSILNASTCMHMINTGMPELSANSGPLQNKTISVYNVTNAASGLTSIAPATGGTPAQTITQTAEVRVGAEGAPYPYDRICGLFTVTTTLTQGDGINTFNYATLQQRLVIKTAALQNMLSAVQPAAQLFAANNDPTVAPTKPDPGYVYAAGQAYISQIAQLATGVQADAGSNKQSWESNTNPAAPLDDVIKLKSYGWIHAGSYYFRMVRALETKLDQTEVGAAPVLPIPTLVPESIQLENGALQGGQWQSTNPTGGPSQLGFLLGTLQQKQKMIVALQRATGYWTNEKANPPPPEGIRILPVSTGSETLDAIVSGLRDGIQNPILEYIQSIATGGDTAQNNGIADPLIGIGQFGGALMLAGELATFVSIVSALFISLAVSWGFCVSSVPPAVLTLFTTIIPLIYSLAIILWTMGATLGVYLPLVPYLVFTMTAFGWIIQVIEAVVAAPLIALALIHPGGEELGNMGKALPILANIFLRPTLMIFGFVLGISLLRAGIALVNFGFIPAITQGAAVSFFSILAVLGMYIGVITVIINKSFSLIYVLPNQIMRFMGASGEGEAAGGDVEKAKGGFDSGAGQGQKALDAGHGKATEMNKASKEEHSEGHAEAEKKKGSLPSPKS